MSVACIFGAPGSGKTVSVTSLPGKSLLLSSDNSAVVLRHFERPNLTIKEVSSFKEYVAAFEEATQTKQYDTVITDCLTDLIDGFIVECREKNTFQDIRQAYMAVYTKIKYLVRKAAYCGTNCVYTCWEDAEEICLPSGEVTNRLSPMLPVKIKQQVLGLCNVIAYVTTANDKNGNKRWFYVMEGSPSLMAKDQIFCRTSCFPEKLFDGEVKK